jgi:hypothetical protein
MRVRRSLAVLLWSLLPAAAACGSGDDNSAPATVSDAGGDVTASDAATDHAAHDGGPETDAAGDASDDVSRGDAGVALALAHVFYIMMENHGYAQIIGDTTDAPYINMLASTYGLATNYFGVTHPSLPNYLAAISGDNQGLYDDCKAGADVFCAPEEFGNFPGVDFTTPGLTDQQLAKQNTTAHWV